MRSTDDEPLTSDENQAQIIELERTVREHSEEIERLVARVVEAEQRADTAEANATDYLDRATCAEEDRTRIEAQARSYKQHAEENETRAKSWEENHQILAEHYARMVGRAETAEHNLKCRDRDARHATAERDALDKSWHQRDAAEKEATRLMIEATGRATRTENRAAAWWEAAKTLCRQRDVCNNAASQGWHTASEYRQRAAQAENTATQNTSNE